MAANAEGEIKDVSVVEQVASKDFWSGDEIKIQFWNRTRNLASRDPRLILEEGAVGGLLRGRMNGKKYRTVVFEEDGMMPQEMTPEKIRVVERPLLKDGELISSSIEHAGSVFRQVSYDLVLDPDADGVCNIRVIFGGMRDNHPKGQRLLDHIKDIRLVLRFKHEEEGSPPKGVVIDMLRPGEANDFDFPLFAFSTFNNCGNVLTTSLLPEHLKVTLVVTAEQEAVNDLLAQPPTCMAAELFLNEKSKKLLVETPMHMTLYEGLELMKDAEQIWSIDPDEQLCFATMVDDPLEHEDLRPMGVSALMEGSTAVAVSPGEENQTLKQLQMSTTPTYGMSSVVHPFQSYVESVVESLGKEDSLPVDVVRAAGSVDEWVKQL